MARICDEPCREQDIWNGQRRQAERAIERAVRAIEGLSENQHDLHRWLAGNGMDLAWRGA